MACKCCNRKDGTCGCRLINQGDKMKLNFTKSTLIEYPQEDLYEDGELSNDLEYGKKLLISEVEKKIIRLWRNDKIVIARWEDLNG